MIRASILTLVAVMILPTGISSAQSSHSSYGDGVHQYFGGQYQDAINSMNSAIAEDSNDVRAYYFRGLAKFSSGDTYGADSDFQQGAYLETANGKKPSRMVSRSLERVQGATRLKIEKFRRNTYAMATGTSTTSASDLVSGSTPMPMASGPIQGEIIYGTPVSYDPIISYPAPISYPAMTYQPICQPQFVAQPMMPQPMMIQTTIHQPIYNEPIGSQAVVIPTPVNEPVIAAEEWVDVTATPVLPEPVVQPQPDVGSTIAEPTAPVNTSSDFGETAVPQPEQKPAQAEPQPEAIVATPANETTEPIAAEPAEAIAQPVAKADDPFGAASAADETAEATPVVAEPAEPLVAAEPTPEPAASDDPFGAEPATQKPAAEPAASDDPFGAAEPAAEPASSDDPFGAAEPTSEPATEPATSDDPFGAAEPATEPASSDDPFGAAEPTSEPAASDDPFGSAEPASSDDPFGAAEPASEPTAGDDDPFG